MNPIPANLLPRCTMRRIILHWTCGRRTANDTDIEHYHFLVEQPDGREPRVIRGEHTIDDNVSTADDDYAAHTRGCNTGSIGLALCGMLNCEKNPFKPGPHPFTHDQWHLMCRAAAQLATAYNIPITPTTVLAHGEVQEKLGIKQAGKWDPMRLPWMPQVKPADVMQLTRETIARYQVEQRAK